MTRTPIFTSMIAAACHSAWYAYTVLALGEDGEPWDTAPRWQMDSILDAVKFWDEQLIEFMGTEPVNQEELHAWARHNLPELSHQNWLKHKESTGWVFGETKDPEAKTHPCMVPYGDLPEDQKKKDAVVVEAYLAVSSQIAEPVV